MNCHLGVVELGRVLARHFPAALRRETRRLMTLAIQGLDGPGSLRVAHAIPHSRVSLGRALHLNVGMGDGDAQMGEDPASVPLQPFGGGPSGDWGAEVEAETRRRANAASAADLVNLVLVKQ